MTIASFLQRLEGVTPKGANRWEARCPNKAKHSHDDSNRSFSVAFDPSTKRILVCCHTGCTFDEICQAAGCAPGELSPEPTTEEKRNDFLKWYASKNGLQFVAAYSYDYGPYSDGLAKVRFKKSDGKKDFRWVKDDPSAKSGFKLTHEGCAHRLYISGNPHSDIIFMAEGEKDADTLHRLTGKAGACTEHGASRTLDGKKWQEEYNAQLSGKTVYLLWDNDEIGREFAENQAKEISKTAAHLYMIDIVKAWKDCPEKGDITDMAQSLGDEETKTRLKELIKATPERQTDSKETAETKTAQQQKDSLTLFDDFMAKVQTRAYEPLKTGMQSFDNLLGGGIQRQALVVLSAAPGSGKTSLAQQIFETMAANGADVIYLNLEMSREQLISRSLSRIIHRAGGNITATGILKGYAWTDEMRRYITPAAAQYRATIAPRMHYNPEGCTTSITSIKETLDRAAQAAKEAGKPAPVCVLDYLHLVTTEQREEQTEIIKKTVAILKTYAIENNTFVFCISANNRTSNAKGVISLESGRDSSSIEYTADIQLSLNYKALHDKEEITYTKADGSTVTEKAQADNPDHMEALQREKPRKMLIQVLKNRMTEPGGKLYVNFDAENSVFIPVETRLKASPPSAEWYRITNDPDNPF